jgi:hypothetical protein
MATKKSKEKTTTFFYFNEYTVHYYSQSSNPWEAAFINCFQNCKEERERHVGIIVFTYPNGSLLPGQEPALPAAIPTNILAGQVNHIETAADGKPFFTIYYDISRFNDVVNLFRYAVVDNCATTKQSLLVSADTKNHVWALCNNLRPQVGAQYKV